jgi:predicted amidohydrolase
MTRIHCHQLAPVIGDPAGNQQLALAAIRSSVAGAEPAGRAEVILLPELVLTGYMFASAQEVREMAIGADDQTLLAWGAAADGALVIGGFAELGDDGNVYNSAAVVGPDGILAVYRKLHLWDGEKLVFTPGSDAPPILETAVGRIAVLICYDLEFPELTRAVALAGADLIAAPTNWPLARRPDGERPPELLISMAAARVNRVAIACCDRTGTERGQEWTAGTSIVTVDGWVAADAGEDGVARADLDLSLARDKTMTALADVFGDRRPDLYPTFYPSLQPLT